MVTAISWEDLMCPTWWPKSVEIFFSFISEGHQTMSVLISLCFRFFIFFCPQMWSRLSSAFFEMCTYLVLAWGLCTRTSLPLFYEKETQVYVIWGSKGRISKLRLLSKWNIFSSPCFVLCVSVYKPHMFTEKSLIPALHIGSMGQAFNAVRSEAFPSSHLSTLSDISNPHVTFV